MEISSSMFLDPTASLQGAESADRSTPLASIDGNQDAGQQFESLFVSMLLKEMRQTSSEDGMFAGDTSDVYGGLFDMFLGQHIASQKAFGIADLINSQLKPAADAGPAPATTTPTAG